MPRDSHHAQEEPRRQVFEAVAGVSRRGFVAGAGLFGMAIPFGSGMVPSVLASDDALAGYYEIWSRTTDSAGDMQPFAVDWNPRGYLDNSVHRIALRVS